MKYTARIEQTHNYKNRIKYIAQTDSFIEKDSTSLGYIKNVPYPYGWITESGTPPQPHLDVYIITDHEFELGDIVEVTIIGVFFRTDGDHKLVGVLDDRSITDFSQLEQHEKDALHRLYSGKYEGEAWLGCTAAKQVITDFFRAYK